MVVSDPVRLVAVVTRDAVEELGLKNGMAATAIVKATNVICSMTKGLASMRLHHRRSTLLRPSSPRFAAVRRIAAGAAAARRRRSPSMQPRRSQTYSRRSTAAQRYSFGGSNTLAAQIQQGAPADVFASANMALPNQLYAKGLCSKPVVFTRNTLVIVVPKSNPAGIRSVYDLTKPGIKLVVAGPGVPVGSYTLQILKNMNLSASVLKNVVSQETDVREVLSKVALGEADAGFVYSTDAKTVPGRVTMIKVPAWAQPKVQYGICVVDASGNKADGQAFITKVLSRAGQAKLVAAGLPASREAQAGEEVAAMPQRSVRRNCSASPTSGRRSSRWSSCCCRSSRSSPAPRRRSSSSSSRTRSSATRSSSA